MSWWDKTKEKANKTLINAHNAAFGPLTSSKYLTEGVLTPEEFVQAGDLLVYKCPTWSWEGGDADKAVPYLPKDKQFLITRKVPCLMRAATLEKTANEAQNQEIEIDGDEGWVETHVGFGKDEPTEIPEIPTEEEEEEAAQTTKGSEPEAVGEEEEEIPDMEEFEEGDNLEDEDPVSLDNCLFPCSALRETACSHVCVLARTFVISRRWPRKPTVTPTPSSRRVPTTSPSPTTSTTRRLKCGCLAMTRMAMALHRSKYSRTSARITPRRL
jgi:hypothetical protein